MLRFSPDLGLLVARFVRNQERQPDDELASVVGPSLLASIWPRCNSTTRRATLGPSPSPPLLAGHRLRERLECALQVLAGDPHARVTHLEQSAPVSLLERDRDLAAGFGKLCGILEQVE